MLKKLARVANPDKNSDTVAFQIVEYTYNANGRKVVNRLDTRILQDGSQWVIDGDGFFPSGTRI